jgi:hypothetical protein
MNDQLIAVNVMPALNVIQIIVDGDCVLLRRDQCTNFLGLFMDAMADSIPDSALGDAGMPSADAHSGVRPLTTAGVEDNVIDLQRYSWRVDGGTA